MGLSQYLLTAPQSPPLLHSPLMDSKKTENKNYLPCFDENNNSVDRTAVNTRIQKYFMLKPVKN